MASGSKRYWSRWMHTARRLSWLLAVLLVLNQALFLFESAAGPANLPASYTLEIATLPAHSSDCTLSKPDGGNFVPALVRASAVVDRPFLSANCTLPSFRVSGAPFGASPSFRTTANHLRV